MEATARILAERLGAAPGRVNRPLAGLGGLISFDVADGDTRAQVETRHESIENATSLGGTRTKIESRHRWEGDRCPAGLLRLSVGLEDPTCSGPISSKPSTSGLTTL